MSHSLDLVVWSDLASLVEDYNFMTDYFKNMLPGTPFTDID